MFISHLHVVLCRSPEAVVALVVSVVVGNGIRLEFMSFCAICWYYGIAIFGANRCHVYKCSPFKIVKIHLECSIKRK